MIDPMHSGKRHRTIQLQSGRVHGFYSITVIAPIGNCTEILWCLHGNPSPLTGTVLFETKYGNAQKGALNTSALDDYNPYYGTGLHTCNKKTRNISRIIFKIWKLNYLPQSGICHIQYLLLIIPPRPSATTNYSSQERFSNHPNVTWTHPLAALTHAGLTCILLNWLNTKTRPPGRLTT